MKKTFLNIDYMRERALVEKIVAKKGGNDIERAIMDVLDELDSVSGTLVKNQNNSFWLTSFGREFVLIPSYLAMIKAAREFGSLKSIVISLVFAGEEFQELPTYRYGDIPFRHTKRPLTESGDDFIGGWWFLETKDGGFEWGTVDKQKLDKIKKIAKTTTFHQNWGQEMAKRTILNEALKTHTLGSGMNTMRAKEDEGAYEVDIPEVEYKAYVAPSIQDNAEKALEKIVDGWAEKFEAFTTPEEFTDAKPLLAALPGRQGAMVQKRMVEIFNKKFPKTDTLTEEEKEILEGVKIVIADYTSKEHFEQFKPIFAAYSPALQAALKPILNEIYLQKFGKK